MIILLALLIILAVLGKQGIGATNGLKDLTLTERGAGIKDKWGYLAGIAGIKYGIPENVVIGVIGTESDGNPNALNKNTNGSTDFGLMQINSKGALADYEKEVSPVFSPLSPSGNIDVGTWYLAKIQAAFPLESWGDKVQAYRLGVAGYRSGRRDSFYKSRFRLFVNA